MGFPGGSAVKNLPAHAGDEGLIPGWGRSTGEGKGNPLQYSCLGNSMDVGALWATVHGISKSRTRLTDCACTEKWSKQFKQVCSRLTSSTIYEVEILGKKLF